jgi:hypothetical protein
MRRIPNLGGAFLALVHLWIGYVTHIKIKRQSRVIALIDVKRLIIESIAPHPPPNDSSSHKQRLIVQA